MTYTRGSSNGAETALAQGRGGGGHADGRAAAERIVALADGLAGPDRALIEAIYGRGLSAAACARMAGRDVRWMQRRVRRLLERLADPRYAFVYARHAEWPPLRRRIARAVYLEGLSRRRAAAELGVSLYRIRQEADRVAAMADAAAEFFDRSAMPGASDRSVPPAAQADGWCDEEDGDNDNWPCDPDDALHPAHRAGEAEGEDAGDPFLLAWRSSSNSEGDDDDDDEATLDAFARGRRVGASY